MSLQLPRHPIFCGKIPLTKKKKSCLMVISLLGFKGDEIKLKNGF